MSTFKYKIEGKEYEVEITPAGADAADVTVNGETFRVETEHEAEPEKKKPVLGQPAPAEEKENAPVMSSPGAEPMRAALPGTITDIRVKVGDEVKAGDTLLVLEAMKMANNIDAEKDGKVTAVCVKVGESVMEDAPLVVVE